ncbi:site-specific integrase [Sandarakinorhabdus cyanobacteriorum]|uniref:site-specific integrase n=1 Tax=Sandarakinorhabdus cyanobacteriorum TaxID=1981098 RepID=UPI0010565A24|nr:site-specific integrase [Sandarakinorhabdus cyanobacteriorum]
MADIKPADLALLAKVERRFLEIGTTDEPNLELLAGRLLLSAVLFGGLLNPNAWRGWFKHLVKVLWMPSHHGFYYKLQPKVFREWYPDPVTGCLRALFDTKLRQAGTVSREWPDPAKLLEWAFADLAESKPRIPGLKKAAAAGPDWLVRTCCARLHMRIPALLADHAAGRVLTHRNTTQRSRSVEEEYHFAGPAYRVERKAELQAKNAERLAEFVVSATPKTAWQPEPLDKALSYLWPAFFPNQPLAGANSRERAQTMRNALDAQIAGWQQPADGNSVHLHLLTWLRQRLDTGALQASPQQKPIRPSTARQYLAYLAGYDWRHIRKTSIHSHLAPERLGRAFQDLSDVSLELPAHSAKWLRAAVASFSDYLHSLNPKIAAVPAPKQTEEASPPRTIVLDTPLFTELLDLLRAWGRTATQPGEPDRDARARACVLASILMYRTGLRGTEVLNLALNDIDIGSDVAELTVRGSAERPNKTPFSRRTLPLHVLMQKDELSAFRQWHARRCDQEYHASPRAKVIPTVTTDALSPEQYLLEPIEAAIRILVNLPLHELTTRKEKGYWHALASPLRHSFATHVITCLVLPDEPIPLPLPRAWTADIVSVERKRRLHAAFLPEGHVGLSVMQAVRYLMGHASHTQSLVTYMHELDWLLAAHLWREGTQPKTSQQQRDKLLDLLPSNARAQKTAFSARHHRRLRNSLAQQAGLPSTAMQFKRGRKAKSAAVQAVSAADDDSLGKYLRPLAFTRPRWKPLLFSPAPSASHQIETPDRGWLALRNLLEWHRRGIDAEQAAEQLALPLADCLRWIERGQRLSEVRVRPRQSPNTPAPGQTSSPPSRRFPQLKSESPRFRGRAAEIIERIWSRSETLVQPRYRNWVMDALKGWQPDPVVSRYRRPINDAAYFLTLIGIPREWLVVRIGNADWQPYMPEMLKLPSVSKDMQDKGMQLTVGDTDLDGKVTKTLRSAVLHGLLLSVIDSEAHILDLEASQP